jgi:hypothetical protein
VAPSGDVHLTIPEIALPHITTHHPDACVVILADDIQHRRFQVEVGLSPQSAERLKARELDAYARADAVFFASRAQPTQQPSPPYRAPYRAPSPLTHPLTECDVSAM